jgi:hypothetical protein
MQSWPGRLLLAAALLGLGWSAGRAQAPVPDFELKIDIPAGYARIECVRGCVMVGARDAGIRNVRRKPEYTFGCSGRGIETCSANVHGFVLPN